MNARERLELSHWRRESFRTLRDAGLEDVPSTFEDRAERVLAAVGWIGFSALICAVLFI